MYPDSLAASPFPSKVSLTIFLICLNSVVYLIVSIHGGPTLDNLIAFGAKENGLIAEGQLFRLISPMFLHGNFLHLLLNMVSLFQIGKPLEQAIGFPSFIMIYIISGITGNSASFFLSDQISVGASSSIFGLLTSLWVIEKYHAKLAKQSGIDTPSSSLGSLIFAWIGISFIIPQLDWASHIGGASAGFLLSLILVFRSEAHLRILNSIRFILPGEPLPNRRFFYRPFFYVLCLIFINVLFLSKIPSITWDQRILGLGRLEAALDTSENRHLHYLKQFSSLFSSKKSEIYTGKLLQTEKSLLIKSNLMAAIPLSKALISIQKIGVGDNDFLSKSNEILLEKTLEMSMTFQVNHNILEAIDGHTLSKYEQKETCKNAAELMNNLSFYSLAGKFYECTYYASNIKNKKIAVKTVYSYIKSKQKEDLNRFLIQLKTGLPAYH